MKFNKINVFLGISLGLSGILINIFIENGYVAFIIGIIWGMIIFIPQKKHMVCFDTGSHEFNDLKIDIDKSDTYNKITVNDATTFYYN